MKFLIDNSVSPSLKETLVRLGHEAVHVREIGLRDASDRQIADAAVDSGATIVAADTDFGEIAVRQRSRRPSVILFRLDLNTPSTMSRLIESNLAAIVADLEQGAIVVVEDARVRIHKLP